MNIIFDYQTIYQIVSKYPNIVEPLIQIGFKDIKNPAMFHTVGKIMTLKMGARIKGIPIETIIEKLKSFGFTYMEEKNE